MSISLYLPETRYVVASIPLDHYGEAVACLREAGEGFVSMTRDKEEITLVIDEEIWRKLAPRFPGAAVQEGRRLIRFDTVLDFSVVGFIAEISRALAEADIGRRARSRIEVRRRGQRRQTGPGHSQIHSPRAALTGD